MGIGAENYGAVQHSDGTWTVDVGRTRSKSLNWENGISRRAAR